ncbi:MAG: TonB family protein [Hyphomicrobiaceae bacterium]
MADGADMLAIDSLAAPNTSPAASPALELSRDPPAPNETTRTYPLPLINLDHNDASPWPDRSRARSLRGLLVVLLPFLGAIALHAAVLTPLLWHGADPIGSGGQELDAIAVDVIIERRNHSGTSQQAPSASAQASRGNTGPSHKSPEKPLARATARRTSSPTADDPSKPEQAHATASDLPRHTAATPKTAEPGAQLPQKTQSASTPPAPPPEPASLPSPDAPPLTKLSLLPLLTLTEEDQHPATPQDVRTAPPLPHQPARTPHPASQPPAEPTKPAAAPAGTASPANPSAATPTSRATRAKRAGEMKAFTRGVARALAASQPPAQNRRLRGTVRITFTIAPSGTLEAIRVRQTSGRDRLDRLALTAVRRAKFPVPPQGTSQSGRSFTIPYTFK